MHELGHNVGMMHSGKTTEINDFSGWMSSDGFAYDDGPFMCFNGAKSWYLGWYSDRHVTVTLDMLPWRGKLVGIDDYLNDQIPNDDDDFHVIANIEDLSDNLDRSVNLFIMYNRQEGVNSGLLENGDNGEVLSDGDRVTITNQTESSAVSWQLGSLVHSTEDSPQDFRRDNWKGTSSVLVIHVCALEEGTPDYAKVLIYLDDGSGAAPECDPPPPTPVPTPMLTPAPTRPPTPQPTPLATPQPSSAPTPVPTPPPTPKPSERPSSEPSESPSVLPSTSPSANPTAEPSVVPISDSNQIIFAFCSAKFRTITIPQTDTEWNSISYTVIGSIHGAF